MRLFRASEPIPFRYRHSYTCLQKYNILGRNKNFLAENPIFLVTFVDKKPFLGYHHIIIYTNDIQI